MILAQPKYLWLFLVMIPLIAWYIAKQRGSRPSLALSSGAGFAASGFCWRQLLRHLLFVLRLGCVACIIIILCRPQIKDSWHKTSTYGTEIMVALDVSTSMLARDFKPDRVEAAKEVAIDFINGRQNDNIGVVVFAGEALTGMPMTIDHAMLKNYVETISTDMLIDGTAIGDGIGTALNRMKDGQAESQTMILITDGSNNTGLTSPRTAAEAAKEMGVKIYTIGVGTNGMAEAPYAIDAAGRIVYQRQPVVIDEATLKDIAEITGGKYFRATNETDLSEIFTDISNMTQTEMDVRHFSHSEDDYEFFGWLALALLGLELLLRYTVVRTMP